MARPRRVHVPAAFFHVTQRGNNRRAIFLDDQDRLRYLGLIGRALPECGARLHAYCLLSNHVHLLLQPDDRPLSDLMHQLGFRYSRCFNDRWSHAGHLFQGRFHSSLIASDAHLLAAVRYIHFNPVRAGLVEEPSDHRWSSHRAYLGEVAPPWLCVSHVRALLGATLADARVSYLELMDGEVDDESIRPCPPDPLAHSGEPERPVDLDQVLQEVAARSGCSVAEICRGRSRRNADARYAVVHLARTLARARISELAGVLDRAPATLCNGVARRLHRPTPQWRELVEGARLSLTKEKEVPDPL